MQVTDAVRRYLAETLRIANAAELAPDLPLVQRGVLDSLELVQVAGYLEQTYGIRVEDTDMVPSNFRSLATMEAFVERKRAAAGG